jgi:hypothetical protein
MVRWRPSPTFRRDGIQTDNSHAKAVLSHGSAAKAFRVAYLKVAARST